MEFFFFFFFLGGEPRVGARDDGTFSYVPNGVVPLGEGFKALGGW